uniref:Metalloendopeptidase n=1 Tax=Strongyloides papillosus TaxID=174720 RepID=A0A0N5C8W3_STREA
MNKKLFFYFLLLLCLKCNITFLVLFPHKPALNLTKKQEEEFGFISSQTCLKFNKKTRRIRGAGINILKSSTVNKVSFPKHRNQPTNIYLKQSNFDDIRSLKYHVGLALGLIPELQRADRDKYVKIFWRNIKSKSKSYFKNKKQSPPSTTFDFGSIMLVGPKYGGVNGRITYKTKLYPYYDSLVYKTKVFSHYNFKTLSNTYCQNRCPKLECKNGGYPSSSRHCEKCICNYFFTGTNCENILTSRSKRCGNSQYYNASSTIQYLNSSRLQGPCYYWISSQNNRNIKITVERLYFDEVVTCTSDKGLFIYYRKDMGLTPLCIFKNVTKFTLPVVSSKIYIIFYGSGLYNSFNISYQSV